jgi:cell division protein FtsW (lipid II flippase)
MNFILESPFLVGLVGLSVAAVLLLAAVQSGKWKLLYGAVGVALVTVVLITSSIVVGVLFESDQTKLKRSIDEIAQSLRQNDRDRALSFIHPNASPTVQRAKSEISQYQFHEAYVTGIRAIEVNQNSKPPTATTEFVATLKVAHEREFSGVPFRGIRAFKIYWMKQGDRWLVRDYEHYDPRMQPNQQPTNF